MQLLFKFNSKLAALEENPKFLPKLWKEAASKKESLIITKHKFTFIFCYAVYCRLVLASGKVSKSRRKNYNSQFFQKQTKHEKKIILRALRVVF